jgi:hypothetical protein
VTKNPRVRSRATRPFLLLLLPLTAIAVLASACGGGSAKASDSPTTSSSPSTSTAGASAASASRAQFTQCLEKNGVPASAATGAGLFGRRGATGSGGTGSGGTGSGGTGSGGTGSPGGSAPTGTRPTVPSQYQAAFDKCRSLLPIGRLGGGFNGSAFTAYRNCLIVHGVTLPAPPTTVAGQPPGTGDGFGAGGFAGLRNNPAYKAAAQACASLLPQRTGTVPTTTPAS